MFVPKGRFIRPIYERIPSLPNENKYPNHSMLGYLNFYGNMDYKNRIYYSSNTGEFFYSENDSPLQPCTESEKGVCLEFIEWKRDMDLEIERFKTRKNTAIAKLKELVLSLSEEELKCLPFTDEHIVDRSAEIAKSMMEKISSEIFRKVVPDVKPEICPCACASPTHVASNKSICKKIKDSFIAWWNAEEDYNPRGRYIPSNTLNSNNTLVESEELKLDDVKEIELITNKMKDILKAEDILKEEDDVNPSILKEEEDDLEEKEFLEEKRGALPFVNTTPLPKFTGEGNFNKNDTVWIVLSSKNLLHLVEMEKWMNDWEIHKHTSLPIKLKYAFSLFDFTE